MPTEVYNFSEYTGDNLSTLIDYPEEEGKYPCVIEIHGGGFRRNTRMTERPSDLSSKCVFVSFDYRYTTQVYNKEDGTTDRDIDIETMSETDEELYKPGEKVRCHIEYARKCVFDCCQQMRYLIDNSEKFHIDTEKIIFTGQSAGTLMCNYLAWVFSEMLGYTCIAVALEKAQLNYTVEAMSTQCLELIAEEVGEENANKDLHVHGINVLGMSYERFCSVFLKNTKPSQFFDPTWNDYVEQELKKIEMPTLNKLKDIPELFVENYFYDVKKFITESNHPVKYYFVANPDPSGNDYLHSRFYAKAYKRMFDEMGDVKYHIVAKDETFSNELPFDGFTDRWSFINEVILQGPPSLPQNNTWIYIVIVATILVTIFLYVIII